VTPASRRQPPAGPPGPPPAQRRWRAPNDEGTGENSSTAVFPLDAHRFHHQQIAGRRMPVTPMHTTIDGHLIHGGNLLTPAPRGPARSQCISPSPTSLRQRGGSHSIVRISSRTTTTTTSQARSNAKRQPIARGPRASCLRPGSCLGPGAWGSCCRPNGPRCRKGRAPVAQLDRAPDYGSGG
jgi:hypothetical protein